LLLSSPFVPPPPDPLPAYAELHCRSNFSFLVGASHPQELVARAAQLGYTALAITDECSVAGVVRAHEEARRQADAGSALRLIVGSEFTLEGSAAQPGCRVVLLAHCREGYAQLCELITRARLRADKGSYRATVDDLAAGLPQCSALLVPRREDAPEVLQAQARWLQGLFGARAAVAAELLMHADDSLLVERLDALAAATGIDIAAAGDVLMHLRSRKAVQDTLTAIRLRTPVADCGYAQARAQAMRTAPSGWPRRCASPSAAASASTSCATSTRPSWCPRATRRSRGCACSCSRARRRSATRRACRPRWRCSSSASWR
jgi:DNA polymerase III alpha subunit